MPTVPLSQVAVHLRPEDNIVVAARNLPAGAEINANGSTLRIDKGIGMGHKVALREIRKGEAIYKYGQIIGFASRDIFPGYAYGIAGLQRYMVGAYQLGVTGVNLHGPRRGLQ